MRPITKLVIPAAGLGTRFLPITKSIPKEMLPLGNKPALQYIIQEGIDAGIQEINTIISPQKTSIIDYFSYNATLTNLLAQNNKGQMLSEIDTIIDQVNFQYSIQDKPLGVANALLKIENFINPGEFFAMAYPDDIILAEKSEMGNLIKIAQEHKAIVFGLIQIPREKISSYGVITPGDSINDRLCKIIDFVEKPMAQDAPSDLAIVGRFVLHHDIFAHIKELPHKENKEIIWFDAIKIMIQKGYTVLGFKIEGKRFDTGTPQGWVECINALNQ
ncbi:UTP--glucose-1-phosphate uridylyltransferase [Candidatus Dependentiae bacterium]|nr:UTP--glucose-1-phosphate uridylyltransferase [Candidatus Dependentiae bacterium]